jgi:hypothetical protein
MIPNRKISGWIGLALALSLGSYFAVKASAGGSACSAHRTNVACSASAGACPASAGTSCSGKGMQAATGCCAARRAAMTQTAEVRLPEGTQMTRVDVKDGIDLVFTGKDLAGIENFLNDHMAACTNVSKDGKKTACSQTCAVQRSEENVVLSIRGSQAEACCATWVEQAALTTDPKSDGAKESEAKMTEKS